MLLDKPKKGPEPLKENKPRTRKAPKNRERTDQLCPMCVGGKLISKRRKVEVPYRTFEPKFGSFTVLSEYSLCGSCRHEVTLAEQMDRNAAQIQRKRDRWEEKRKQREDEQQ